MANIFELIPDDLTNEVFESLSESQNIKIERIISKGHTSPDTGWYQQKQSEWVIVLKGEARLAFEASSTVTLKPGDYLNILPEQKHKVEWTAADCETIWLAIHY